MTAGKPAGPAWDVEVEFSLGHPNYLILARSLYDADSERWWEELGDLLNGRPGWHCDYTNEGLLWSFGAMGSSLFNVSPHTATFVDSDGDVVDAFVWDQGFELFDCDADKVVHFDDMTAMRVWLEANESRHADHLRNLSEFVSGNNWEDFSRFEFDARVTHDDGTFIGTVPKVPSEMVGASDLPSVVRALQELMAYAFGAPAEAAEHVRLNVQLDTKAAQAIL